ncbi:MAG: DUF3105 domain-containing protein [Anaerolineales bacterium]
MTLKAKDIRKAKQSEWARRERRRRVLMWSLWGGVALLVVGTILYLAWKQAQPIPRTGVDVPIQSADHIPVGATHEPYNSDPPTSGPHYADPAQAGFYNEAPPDGMLVHSLEHGYIIISYNCSELAQAECDQLKSQISSAMQAAGTSPITGTPKLIATPRPTMDTQLALTSWGRLDKFDQFDRSRIVNFVKAFRDRAPEPSVP